MSELTFEQLINNLQRLYVKFNYTEDNIDDFLNYYLEDRHIIIIKQKLGNDWDTKILKFFTS